MKQRFFMLLYACIMLVPASAYAWTDHTILSSLVFADDADLSKKISAEPLTRFLMSERKGLASALAAEEQWLREHLYYYPQRPDSLAFNPELTQNDLRASFLRAIRVNPTMPLPLFVQLPPGRRHNRDMLSVSMVSIIPVQIPNGPFEKLSSREKVSAYDVLCTASDEPDYGLDVNLYENNRSSFGKEYGFGVQPWGNDAYAYGTQAPFHMGFFHENPLIAAAAPFSQKSLAEYRFHQYSALSSFAFRTGHPYWGYRFAGWALHYLQDSLSIYHERMLPGVSTPSIIQVAVSGDEKARNGFLSSVSNKHYIYEDYAYYAMTTILSSGAKNDPILSALSDRSRDQSIEPLTPLYIRDVTGALSESRSDRIDALVTSSFPAKFISDPAYIYGTTEPAIDLFSFLKKNDAEKSRALNASYREVFMDLGAYSRAFVRWVSSADMSASVGRSFLLVWMVLSLAAAAALFFLFRHRRRKRLTRKAAAKGKRK